VLPKTYAINNADRTALAVAPLMRGFTWTVWPLTRAMQLVVRGMLRLVGIRIVTELGSDKAEEELRGAIDLHAETAVELPEASAMLHSILDLSQVTVADIMVHRQNVTMIDMNQPTDKIVDEVLNSPYTRVPLFKEDVDNVVGILHAKALLRAVRANPSDVARIDLAEIAVKPWFVPDTTSLLAQLEAFRERREHFALVVDEYGALMGIVTLEDILEEIVGQIEDEHDIKPSGLRLATDGSIEVDGQVTIRDLNREFGWKLPDEHASTIAGLVLYEARRIPEAGQVFVFYDFRFEVLERQRNQIKRLKITPLATAPAAPAAAAL
jgi:Mg2+/Co2+ transporter CorB